MPLPILLIGTLDTKGHEYAYALDLLHRRGHPAIVMDVGVIGEPKCPSDITADQVARRGGQSLAALRQAGDRNSALDCMALGAVPISLELLAGGGLGGVLALGGSGGTAIGTAVMRALPIGLPKVMLSTLASGDTKPYVGESDIAMMFPVVDIEGLNRISRPVIANAVGAVCGMAEQSCDELSERPLIAATMFGVTTPCVTRLRAKLEAAGYEVVVFHATGSGGRAMEKLIRSGFFDAVADLTTTEWADEIAGGVLSAGPDRLTAAAESGVPQVVSCGALDMVNFWALNTVPARYRQRTLHTHNDNVTLMRTSREECVRIAEAMAERLNRATGPVCLFFPLQGVSALDATDQPFCDPEARQALFDTLQSRAADHIKTVALDVHINNPDFADHVADHLVQMLKTIGRRPPAQP
ncbi:MAG: Tm-1-like ATP-binding domain-containing protein [Bacteroidota bacterium]|nr:Tm-1-like ATP-binding domain-containing protein [Bacteroidota bacterium]